MFSVAYCFLAKDICVSDIELVAPAGGSTQTKHFGFYVNVSKDEGGRGVEREYHGRPLYDDHVASTFLVP